MKKMIFSAILAGAFLFGTVYAQTAAPSTSTAKPETKKEAKASTAKPEASAHKKGHGNKHSSKKEKTAAKPAESK